MRSCPFITTLAALSLVYTLAAQEEPKPAPKTTPVTPTTPSSTTPAPVDPAPAIKPTTETPAEKTFNEDRFQKLRGEMDDLKGAFEVQIRKLTEMQGQIRKLREENEQLREAAAKPTVTPEELKQLAGKLVELDQNRIKDRDLLMKEVAAVLKTLSGEIGRKPKPNPKSPPVGSHEDPVKGYEHVVQKGEFLSTIISAYNDEFKKTGKKSVTTAQVMDANPNLQPQRLLVGQKILIPMPPN